jgi:hypothetical protein
MGHVFSLILCISLECLSIYGFSSEILFYKYVAWGRTTLHLISQIHFDCAPFDFFLFFWVLAPSLPSRLAPHFLPSHTRGNRTAALLANAAQELASASPESETTTTIVADRRGGGSSSNSWGGSSGGSSHNRRDNKPNTRRPSYRALQDLDHREDALQEENQKEDEDKRRTLLAPNQRHSDRSGGANNENRKNSRSNNNGKSGGRGDKSGRGGSANQQEASFKPRSFPWPVRGGATNDGFGVGLWAVLIDARALGLRDGDNWQYGVSAPSPTENDDNDNEDDGTLDEPAANRRREAAIARVLEYLATIPTEEKTRMRSEIIAAVGALHA